MRNIEGLNNNGSDINQRLDLLSPDFSNIYSNLIKDGNNCYLSTILLPPSNLTNTLQICITPNVQYTLTAYDLKVSDDLGIPVYNIADSLVKNGNRLTYSINYFIPQEVVLNKNDPMLSPVSLFLKSTYLSSFLSTELKTDLSAPNFIFPVTGESNFKKELKRVGYQIKLVFINEQLQEFQNWFSLKEYGLEWEERINQIEEIKHCLRNPNMPYLNDNSQENAERVLEDAKIEVAIGMLVKGAWIGITSQLSGTADYKDLKQMKPWKIIKKT